MILNFNKKDAFILMNALHNYKVHCKKSLNSCARAIVPDIEKLCFRVNETYTRRNKLTFLY